MKKILSNFEKIFIIFLYLQPFLDVSFGILSHYNINVPISSFVRIIFLLICITYLLLELKNKRIKNYLISLGIYFIIFISSILYFKGINALLFEVKNLITTYYFTIILITLISLYKKSKLNVDHLKIIYIIYILLVFIPNILHIGFDSYWHSKEGKVGWFLSANVVGSILSILLPIVITNIKKINFLSVLMLIINLYIIFEMGTKVPVLSFVIIIAINFFYYLIMQIKKSNYKIIIILVIPLIIVSTLFITIYPKTSFHKNLVIHTNYLKKKHNNHINMDIFIDHIIFSERLSFEKKTRRAYENSSIIEKFVGIGYIENYATDNVRIKTIEIDYFDIFYRHGILGFIIFFIPIVYSIKSIIKNIKYESFKKINIITSIILIFVLALFQGHIFVTPANSIYVALILSLTLNNSFLYKNC